MVGYSKHSLTQKLGIKEGVLICLLHSPTGYTTTLGKLPIGIQLTTKLGSSEDFIQAFYENRNEFESEFPSLKKSLTTNGILWISWPKKASQMPTDLDEKIIREVGLKNGLVDVKVAAITETWSGLKFVYRLKDR